LAASQPDPRAQNVHIERKHRPGRPAQTSPSSRRESTIRPRPPARPIPTPPQVERAPSRITRPNRPAVENNAVIVEIPTLRPNARPSASPITFGKFNRDSNVPPARQEGGLTSQRRKAHDVVLKSPARGQEGGARSRRDPAPWNPSEKKTGYPFRKGKPAKDFGKKTKRKA
jgi:hypothetical protein